VSSAPLKRSTRMVAMKPEYYEGPEARKKFEEGMTKLFQSPKDGAKDKLKPKRKRKKSSKG